MNVVDLVNSIKVIDNPKNLRAVSDTVFQDATTEKYYSSTNKGLNTIYRTIGLYDKVFIRKLRSLDQVYSDNLVNDHLSKVTSDNVFFTVNNNLRVMNKDLFNVMSKLFESIKNESQETEVTENKDTILFDLLMPTVHNLLEYNLNTSRLAYSYYLIFENRFYGLLDQSFELDDNSLVHFSEINLLDQFNETLLNHVTWGTATTVVRKLKDKSDKATEILVNATDNSDDVSPYTAQDLYELIYSFYDANPNKLKDCITQSDFVNKNIIVSFE